MKQIALFAAISALSFAAAAQTPAPAPAETALRQSVAAPDAVAQGEERVKPASPNKRADGKGRRFATAPSRVYSREDLVRTGRIELADALRALDPAIH